MTLAGYIFLTITRPRFSAPLGLLAIVGLCWWGTAAYRLVRQFEEHAPVTMSLTEAVKASRDGEVYVRISDVNLDCDKALSGRFGTVFALSDADGHVAAMARLGSCPPAPRLVADGVFLEPPFGLYGSAVAQGWDVTPGHLAFFDQETRSSRAWTRIGLSVGIPLFVIGCILSGVVAERRPRERRTWRMRALGLGMMGGISWFFYYAHEYVFLRVIPASAFMAVAFVCALAFAVVPNHPYMRKVGQQLLGDA